MSAAETQKRIEELGAWFQNLTLNGVQTAPHHFLGDYPAVKFAGFAEALPNDLTGKSVLDIGCNAGFYSLEMKRRGAERVLGVDFDERYLAQARFAAEVRGVEIEFRQLSVYDVGSLGEKFDIIAHPEEEVFVCRVRGAEEESDVTRATKQGRILKSQIPNPKSQ